MKKKRRGCLMTKFKVGQKVRVVADSFKADPRGLDIGSVYTIESISLATPFNESPQMAKLVFALRGQAVYDLPECNHVKTGDNPLTDYANIVFEDIELVDDLEGKKIRMLEDDIVKSYMKGDVFEIRWSEDTEEYVFFDREGYPRPLDVYAHEVI